MGTIAEIEAAIEKLPTNEVNQLADWLESFRIRRSTPPSVDAWISRARGAATAGVTTANIMALTRGDE